MPLRYVGRLRVCRLVSTAVLHFQGMWNVHRTSKSRSVWRPMTSLTCRLQQSNDWCGKRGNMASMCGCKPERLRRDVIICILLRRMMLVFRQHWLWATHSTHCGGLRRLECTKNLKSLVAILINAMTILLIWNSLLHPVYHTSLQFTPYVIRNDY